MSQGERIGHYCYSKKVCQCTYRVFTLYIRARGDNRQVSVGYGKSRPARETEMPFRSHGNEPSWRCAPRCRAWGAEVPSCGAYGAGGCRGRGWGSRCMRISPPQNFPVLLRCSYLLLEITPLLDVLVACECQHELHGGNLRIVGRILRVLPELLLVFCLLFDLNQKISFGGQCGGTQGPRSTVNSRKSCNLVF